MGSSHFKVKSTHKKQATAASKRRLADEVDVAREPTPEPEGEGEVEAREPAQELKVVKRAETPSDDCWLIVVSLSPATLFCSTHKTNRYLPASTGFPSSLAPARHAACLSGSFYTSPTIGSTHPVLHTPLLISWDASLSCLPGPLVDVYLYAPHSAMPRIHLWKGVQVEDGSVEVELMPRWWNATTSEELQIQIVQQNTPPFLSPLPAGPVFTATYTPPSDGTLPLEADTSIVDIGETDLAAIRAQSTSSSKGRIAAGVIIPLLVLALGVGLYLRWRRRKGMEERKKWTEAVDKRMSTISVDWKSVTHVGAQEAIRKSFAANRASTFSFNGGSPSGGGEYTGNEKDGGATGGTVGNEQRRPGVGLRNPSGLANGERVSRVSFANDPRPSSESRRTKTFRDSYVPPVPSLPPVSTSPLASNALAYNPEDGGEGALSPTQTEGAFSLTPEAIRARIAAGRARSASNASRQEEMDVGDIGPALSMMRTGGQTHNPAAASSDDLLFAVPATPQPAYSSPLAAQSFSSPMASTFNTTAPLNVQHHSTFSAYGGQASYGGHSHHNNNNNNNYSNGQGIERIASPVTAMPAMQAMPAAVMSPDDMLRAYAERKKSMSATPSTGISSSSSHGTSSSSLSQTAGVGAGGMGVGGIAYPQPVAGTGRTLFNGNAAVQGTGERKERTPSLGFAPGEYDPDFTFEK